MVQSGNSQWDEYKAFGISYICSENTCPNALNASKGNWWFYSAGLPNCFKPIMDLCHT